MYAPRSYRLFTTSVLQTLLLLILYCTSAVWGQVNPVTPSASVTTAATTTSATIASTAAAGGLTVTLPNQTKDASYYKIAPAVNVTFAWNFTSVLSYGTSLTIQAYCTSNSNTYTITSLPATATEVIWNPYSYSVSAVARGSAALVQETYRLQIFDERGLDAGSSPGLMSPNENTDFALYIPQSYTALAGECGNLNMARKYRNFTDSPPPASADSWLQMAGHARDARVEQVGYMHRPSC